MWLTTSEGNKNLLNINVTLHAVFAVQNIWKDWTEYQCAKWSRTKKTLKRLCSPPPENTSLRGGVREGYSFVQVFRSRTSNQSERVKVWGGSSQLSVSPFLVHYSSHTKASWLLYGWLTGSQAQSKERESGSGGVGVSINFDFQKVHIEAVKKTCNWLILLDKTLRIKL